METEQYFSKLSSAALMAFSGAIFPSKTIFNSLFLKRLTHFTSSIAPSTYIE